MSAVTATTAYLGLGSNEGDREAAIRAGLAGLEATPGVAVLRVSQLTESELHGDGPPQGPFLNGVAELASSLPAQALLGVLQALEVAAGRSLPAPRGHPRPLDLDLLAYGDAVIDLRGLRVPHPRWHEREFVLGPLRELGVDTSGWHRWQQPEVFDDPAAFSACCARWRAGGCEIGLVPTMGALHAGHRSLIERARAECDRVVVTVFVNPLQFGQGEDLTSYPRFLARDVELCRDAGVDVVFAPADGAMYGEDFCSLVAVGRAAETMEGAVRPDHFTGVATVVVKLLAMSGPQRAYFGEKDAQQLAVIRRACRDLGFPIEIVGCPIVRESDGLALSSRNVYLGPEDRAAATVLFRALGAARQAFRDGERDRDALIGLVADLMRREPHVAVDYVELRREGGLEPLPPGPVDSGRLLVAARFAGDGRPVRLIDNMSLVEGCTES